jgi:uncharacterized protein (TIGR00251 family)
MPNALKDEIVNVMGDALKIRITTPPVDGKANKHLIAYLSNIFKLSKNNITILSGSQSRFKYIAVKAPKHLPDIIKPASPEPTAINQNR